MYKENITFEGSGKNKKLVYILSQDEIVDAKNVVISANRNIKGIVQYSFEQINLNRCFKYQIGEMKTIKEYISSMINKKNFLMLLSNLFIFLVELKEENIEINRLIFDINYVYVDKKNLNINYLYMPIRNLKKESDLNVLIKEIIYTCKFSSSENIDYVKNILRYLKSNEAENLIKFKNFIDILLQESYQNNFKNEISVDYFGNESNYNLKDNFNYKDQRKEKSNIKESNEDNKFVNIYEEENNKNNLYLDVDDKKEDDEEYENCGTQLLEEEEEGTSILNYEESKYFPYLIRKKNNEKIQIVSSEFKIGSDRNWSDYFISDNKFVSHKHAKIIKKNGEYFIIDNKSSNHIYINSKKIDKNIEFKIKHNDEIRLANEEFIFKIY